MSNEKDMQKEKTKEKLTNKQKENMYPYVSKFYDEVVNYRKYVQKKLNDFLKMDVAFFTVIQVFYKDGIGIFSAMLYFLMFVFAFSWKLYMISSKLIEYSLVDDRFWIKAKEKNFESKLMKELFHGKKWEIYHDEFQYYKKIIKKINLSIFLSQFSIILLIMSKFIYNLDLFNQHLFVVDIITASVSVVLFVGISCIIYLSKPKLQNSNNTIQNGKVDKNE